MNPVQGAISQAFKPEYVNPELVALNIKDFLTLKIPPQENILTPIIKTQSLSMMFAKRGVGKTHVALGMAYAIASGGKFLKWEAPKPRRVLYLDGEMPACTMQERLAQIIRDNDAEAAPENFKILTPDLQKMGMPDISTSEGQQELEPLIQDAELIFVDNLSTLARTGKENEAESWLPVQGWGLDMRSRGKSVMFVHHAGKSGLQRGSSRREDVLDTVIELRHPVDYRSDEGARFEVHFTKARHLKGQDAIPFEAKLLSGGWSLMNIDDAEIKKVLELQAEGLSYRDIADETGISKSRVQRMIRNHDV
jgi:putative DNA primase/helicase